MDAGEFQALFVEASSEVADEFYPKNEIIGGQQTERSRRRGEYLRDQGVLCAKLMQRLFRESGVARG